MFSILRFRRGCLYFRFYSSVWVSLILLQGLILSALEGAIITRQQGHEAEKKLHDIISLHLPQMCPCSEWHQPTFKSCCPFRFHPEEPSGREKPTTKTPRRDYAGRNVTHQYPWLHRSLSLVVWIRWSLDGEGEGRANLFSSRLISRSAAPWWWCACAPCGLLPGQDWHCGHPAVQAGRMGFINLFSLGLVIFFQIWRKKVKVLPDLWPPWYVNVHVHADWISSAPFSFIPRTALQQEVFFLFRAEKDLSACIWEESGWKQ